MKAILLSEHGGPEALRLVERPDPTPEGDQIAVAVSHVGLNHLDLWVRRGVPGHRFALPLIPGSDLVGRRMDTGALVALQPGFGCGACARCLSGAHDRCRHYKIRGETTDGGLCSVVLARPAELLPIEGGLDPAQAAAAPLALLTAWHMLVTRARVRAGDRVLVQAGASGVGIYAIQVARLFGAEVAAVASTPEKRQLCRDLGAVEAWDRDGLRAGLRAWTDKEGVDIVVDHVGAETWEASLQALRWGGTYVTCGATTGHSVPLNLRALFFKQLNLLGSTMGGMGELREAWGHLLAGRIRPVVHAVLPASRLAEAHALLEGRSVAGKVVVAWDLG